MKKLAIISIALLVFPFVGNAQSTDQNYVRTTAYQVATTTGNVILDEKLETITYYDGLGRPLQVINARAGGNRENIVSYMEYDALGMQTREYLPWVTAGQVFPVADALDFIAPATLKSDITTYYDAKYGANSNPFSETVYEDSPLLRTMEQAAPGDAWSLANGHTIKLDYQLNGASIYRFSVGFVGGDYSEPELLHDGNFGSNELFVTETRDENWEATDGIHGKVYEFTNKSGQVVLKRTTVKDTKKGPLDPNYHDTYYVYDDYGNLTYVIPPEASDIIVTGFSIDPAVLDSRGYQYKYDRRNRLIWKKLPGKGFEVVIYDTEDRPILTQDALMRAENPKKYLFTKYDCLGRVAYTGFHISNYSFWQDVQSDVPNAVNCEVMQSSSSLVGDTQAYYSNTAYPTASLELLTINYYDSYMDFAPLTRPTNVYGVNPGFTNTQGLPTVSKVKVLNPSVGVGPTDWITSLTEYDPKGRAIYSASHNPYLDTTDIVKSQLDFTGKPEESTTTHSRTGRATITVIDYFAYDHAGRLSSQTQKIDNQPIQRIAENTYDDRGQLVTKEVGGSTLSLIALQDVEFQYNIRGWLTQINDIADAGPNPKLFNFRINYDVIEGGGSGTALYNGNIAQTLWKTANTDADIRSYNYSYDDLNRIEEAKGYKGAAIGSMQAYSNHNVEAISYDKNGNILSLQRTGSNEAGSGYGQWDNLDYSYLANQLVKVDENSTDGSYKNFGFLDGHTGIQDDFEYDVNGNMVKDRNKAIDVISYNHLNLPVEIDFETAPKKITYIYDATGIKLSKSVTDEGSVTTEYAGGFIYSNEGSGTMDLQFLSHPEGYVIPTLDTSGGFGGSVTYSDFDYVFQYKDHLGNVRLSYGDTNTDGTISLTEIIEESNYYPFGLKQKGYNNTVSGNGNALAQNWKHSGKELNSQLGLDWYDFGARNYDASIGRWMNIDPLGEDYYNNSPYNYVANTPLIAYDPDGKRISIVGSTEYKSQVLMRLLTLAFKSETGAQELLKAINAKETLIFFDPGEGTANLDMGNADRHGNRSIGFDLNKENDNYSALNGRNGQELESNANDKLGHELAHFNLDDSDSGPLLESKGIGGQFKASEVQAVEIENKIRKELGMDERTHYMGVNVYGKTTKKSKYTGYYELTRKRNYAEVAKGNETRVNFLLGRGFKTLTQDIGIYKYQYRRLLPFVRPPLPNKELSIEKPN